MNESLSAPKQPPVIFVVGPTGAGKSDFALSAAEAFKGIIVNADSVQVYQSVDIGTAKPSLEERRRRPHFLFDFVAPKQTYTAGQYRSQAMQVIHKEVKKHPVFVVGGSGFYVQALQKGMYSTPEVPQRIRDEVRQQAEQEGLAGLYKELQEKDPEYAAKISENDTYRIQRSVSIVRAHGKSLSDIQAEFARQNTVEAFPYPMIKMGIYVERSHLRQRVRKRAQAMLQAGLLEEVQGLLDQDLIDWAPLQSVGYKETVAFLQGQLSREELEDEIVKNTMRLAKRQMTWFRRDQEISWFDGLAGWSEPISFLQSQLDKVY